MRPDGKILAVAGPTASGKSDLAMALAGKYNGEIVCCDSMQIYRGMDIGTAKPTEKDRAEIPHHMVDFLDPGTKYSCADYAAAASACVDGILDRGRLPVICGGTGLYLDSLLYERPYEESNGADALRETLQGQLEREGPHAMWEKLSALDPESAAEIHENNTRRVIRALEIRLSTGKKKSELDRVPLKKRYHACVLVLHTPDRELQNRRIALRTEKMLEAGLLEETRRLLAAGALAEGNTAAQAIGYKEMLSYLAGTQTLAQAEEALVIATRQYAKRQDTWFRRTQDAHRIELTAEQPDPYPRADAIVRAFLET